MKGNKYLVVTLLLLVVYLGTLAVKFTKEVAAGSFHSEENFAAFKEKKLKLPVVMEPVCLIAVGDIMLSRGVAGEIRKQDNDIHPPFAKIKSRLQGGDIVFGNLEGPITGGRQIAVPEMVLRHDPGIEFALKEAGFSILSLANNHLSDFGPRGLLDTLGYLDNAGIDYVGAGETAGGAFAPKYIEVKGLNLAFLAFHDPGLVPQSYLAGEEAPGTSYLDLEKMDAVVKKAGEQADFVVVSMHAGTEYAPQPDRKQVNFARRAIDAGADLVLGHHPHVVQRVERYRGKFILYSLGNFVFDQTWSRETREGLAAKIFINQRGIEKIEFVPFLINDSLQPQALVGEEAKRVLEKVGLPFKETDLPAWDAEKHGYMKSTRFTFTNQKMPERYRLMKEVITDLDGDGETETYSLRDGKLIIDSNSLRIWETPGEWWVDDFFLGDVNNDGIEDVNLLVWKEGSFGPCKPFWHTEEDRSVKNHLFIFKLVNDDIKPVWQSSNLDRPNYHTTLGDFNGDGLNELFVTEGSYNQPGQKEISVWNWNGWGFTKVS